MGERSRAALTVVPERDAYALLGWGGEIYPHQSSPADCVLQFALNPECWPDDVDFWACLTKHFPRNEAVMMLPEGEGRISRWCSLHDIRAKLLLSVRFPESGTVGPATMIDFWFLGAVLEAMTIWAYHGKFMRISDPQLDRLIEINSIRLPISRWMRKRLVWKDTDWRTTGPGPDLRSDLWGCLGVRGFIGLKDLGLSALDD